MTGARSGVLGRSRAKHATLPASLLHLILDPWGKTDDDR
jgi:hypothetical protein